MREITKFVVVSFTCIALVFTGYTVAGWTEANVAKRDCDCCSGGQCVCGPDCDCCCCKKGK